mmetsp:Transcript_14195/g.25640  ORF Transcript_14195/g.25640 Transcript_14195/m.25640 type:complete len:216 (+) Transcript_14195:303-950(+)
MQNGGVEVVESAIRELGIHLLEPGHSHNIGNGDIHTASLQADGVNASFCVICGDIYLNRLSTVTKSAHCVEAQPAAWICFGSGVAIRDIYEWPSGRLQVKLGSGMRPIPLRMHAMFGRSIAQQFFGSPREIGHWGKEEMVGQLCWCCTRRNPKLQHERPASDGGITDIIRKEPGGCGSVCRSGGGDWGDGTSRDRGGCGRRCRGGCGSATLSWRC